MTNPKYYWWSESKQLWVISKKINGTNKYFGYYKTEKAAKLAVELFKKYGWNKENIWRVKYEVKELLKKDEVDK